MILIRLKEISSGRKIQLVKKEWDDECAACDSNTFNDIIEVVRATKLREKPDETLDLAILCIANLLVSVKLCEKCETMKRDEILPGLFEEVERVMKG